MNGLNFKKGDREMKNKRKKTENDENKKKATLKEILEKAVRDSLPDPFGLKFEFSDEFYRKLEKGLLERIFSAFEDALEDSEVIGDEAENILIDLIDEFKKEIGTIKVSLGKKTK